MSFLNESPASPASPKVIYSETKQVGKRNDSMEASRRIRDRKDGDGKDSAPHSTPASKTTVQTSQATPATKQAKCPRCGSTQITATKNGANLPMGTLGLLTFGLAGAALGLDHHSRDVTAMCASCGDSWNPKEQYHKKQILLQARRSKTTEND